MTTLREEIEDRLELFWSENTNFFTSSRYTFEACSLDILKLIDKRIDLLVKQSEYDEEVEKYACKIKRLLK